MFRPQAANPWNNVIVEKSPKPWCGDIDDDGDKDCIVGTGEGYIQYFLNTGSASRPVFQEVT